MTATRGGVPEPTDSQGLEDTGPSTDETASAPPAYDIGARWNRYKAVGPVPIPGGESPYWATVSARLLFHPTLTGRVRHRQLVIDVWCALYVTLMAGRLHDTVGEVDPCKVAAALGVSDRTVRRALATLEDIGAVTRRERVRKGNTVWIELDAKKFGNTRG